MVNQKQTDSPKTLAKNLTLCAESTKNISVLTNKPKRTRKSTSSIAELISSKVEPDQIPDVKKISFFFKPVITSINQQNYQIF